MFLCPWLVDEGVLWGVWPEATALENSLLEVTGLQKLSPQANFLTSTVYRLKWASFPSRQVSYMLKKKKKDLATLLDGAIRHGIDPCNHLHPYEGHYSLGWFHDFRKKKCQRFLIIHVCTCASLYKWVSILGMKLIGKIGTIKNSQILDYTLFQMK